MKRPWQTWSVFALCLAVVLVAMAWISAKLLELDLSEKRAQQTAAFEENIRLSLWRMEYALVGLIAQEGNHPYFEYSAFYPLNRAYTRMFNTADRGETLVPSRLLIASPPQVLLHFQIDPAGAVTSPQVPTGEMRELAEAAYATEERIDSAAAKLAKLAPSLNRAVLREALPLGTALPEGQVPDPGQNAPLAQRNSEQAQAALSQQEFQRRNLSQVSANYNSNQIVNDMNEALASNVRVGALKALWIGEALVLARRVNVGAMEYIQGSWLHWQALKKELLEEIKDLLPEADLIRARESAHPEAERRLAALPVKLSSGPIIGEVEAGITVIQFTLIMAWICVMLAGGATAVLLRGALSLSERRGAFVSAVTHELRTPLTTLRMYTEMLATKMVPSEERRQQYLSTLQSEADRLGHLVENVLAYSRLEGNRGETRLETLTASALLDRVAPRLKQHAERAAMDLAVRMDDEIGQAQIRTDAGAVEQILFNLVDNACKYASTASDKTLHLEADLGETAALIQVRDHGPGILKGEGARLFQPFRKSAAKAASSAPGVGLGLALSRRLAREIGGDLLLDKSFSKGARFVLRLPLA